MKKIIITPTLKEYILLPIIPPLSIYLCLQFLPQLADFLNGTVIVFVCVYIIAAIHIRKWTWKQLGVEFGNITLAKIGLCFAGLAAGIGWLWILGHLNPEKWDFSTQKNIGLVKWAGLGVFGQVLIFQGYLPQLGNSLEIRPWINFSWNAISFIGMHLIFSDLGKVMPIIIPASILFAGLYWKCRNSLLVSIVHMPLTAITILELIFKI